MESSRSDVLARLAAADPLPEGLRPDEAAADRLHAAIVATPRRAPIRARPSRRAAVVAVAVAVLAVAAPAFAVSDGLRSIVGLGGSGHPAVLEQSRLMVTAPVAEGTVARLWESPSKIGGVCAFVTLAPPGDVVTPPKEIGGGGCPRMQTSSLNVTVEPRPPGTGSNWVPPLVQGYIDPVMGATRVEVRWSGGAKELAYANGYFVGAIEALYEPSPELRPIRLIAYDGENREVYERELEAAWFRIE